MCDEIQIYAAPVTNIFNICQIRYIAKINVEDAIIPARFFCRKSKETLKPWEIQQVHQIKERKPIKRAQRIKRLAIITLNILMAP